MLNEESNIIFISNIQHFYVLPEKDSNLHKLNQNQLSCH
jgi:hypothetical protein